MDTDDLSNELYKAVFSEADSFNHDLSIQFGLVADECDSEKEYETAALTLIRALRKTEPANVDDIFFGEVVDREQFLSALQKIEDNIRAVQKIPLNKRTFDAY